MPPIQALEPFLLAVLKWAGDYRDVTRELEKVLSRAKTIRRAFARLPKKDVYLIGVGSPTTIKDVDESAVAIHPDLSFIIKAHQGTMRQ